MDAVDAVFPIFMFQSTPLSIERSDIVWRLTSSQAKQFQSTPLSIERSDSFTCVHVAMLQGFNPRPSP